MHVALPPRARQQRDGAQLDGDDARRHGGERQLSDDVPAPDASVLVPSWSFSLFCDRTNRIKSRISFSGSVDVSQNIWRLSVCIPTFQSQHALPW